MQPRRPGFAANAWLLFLVPIGFTTWAAFVYAALRARRYRWLAWALVYAALLAGYVTLDTPDHPSSTAQGWAAGMALLSWIGGGVHALVIRRDVNRRIQARADPALEAAKTRMERRAEERRLLAHQPALAREAGVGRPDIPGADSYGLVDVNHVPAQTLTLLPGVTPALAKKIIEARDAAGGYSSVEDLGEVNDLPPALLDKIRDAAVFIQD